MLYNMYNVLYDILYKLKEHVSCTNYGKKMSYKHWFNSFLFQDKSETCFIGFIIPYIYIYIYTGWGKVPGHLNNFWTVWDIGLKFRALL